MHQSSQTLIPARFLPLYAVCDMISREKLGVVNMKNNWILLFSVLLLICMISPVSAGEAAYTVTSVTDCAQTSAIYDRFYQSGDLSCLIPGLSEGLIPQGIAWMPTEDWLLFAGYRSDKGASALVALDRKSGEIAKQVSLRYADGSVYSGHAGGVCVTESDIYISNDSSLFRISLDTFLALPKAGECRFDQVIQVPVNASYCCYEEDVLWVGEFQYTGDYPTDRAHYMKTADGLQKAWTCGYKMEEGQNFTAPDYIFSMTERIQGITVKDGQIYLSQSYGRRNPSVVYRYSNVLAKPPHATVMVSGKEVPLWILDSSVCEDALICPPMTECLCMVPEGICVLFESAAEKYMDSRNPSVNPMDRVFVMKDF